MELSKKCKNKKNAQILVTTLLVLIIVALTVFTITMSTIRNQRQVINNLEYEESYNYAENRIIQTAEAISDLGFDLKNLNLEDLDGAECAEIKIGEYICTFEEENGRRTILKIYESNEVESYELGPEDYFDIILTSGFGGAIDLSWDGVTALDLELIYEQNGKLRAAHSIIDTTGEVFYNGYTKKSGFLKETGVMESTRARINLAASNLQNLPGTPGLQIKFKYLRVKAINNEIGSRITIKPEVGTKNLPAQVRKVEALSYDSASVNSSAPVAVAQYGLNPQLPLPLTYNLEFKSINTPKCGNKVQESAEYCDDGNKNDNDDCPNDCTCPAMFSTLKFFTQKNDQGICDVTPLANGAAGARKDASMDVSSIIEVCAQKDTKLYWDSSSGLDDMLIIIPSDKKVDVEVLSHDHYRYIIPKNHLIIAPTDGNMIWSVKTVSIKGTSKSYTWSQSGQGSIQDFQRAGFNTASFEKPLNVNVLYKLGYVGKDKIARFKMVHIASGCGFARIFVHIEDYCKDKPGKCLGY